MDIAFEFTAVAVAARIASKAGDIMVSQKRLKAKCKAYTSVKQVT